MLHLHRGRESSDLESYLFDAIKGRLAVLRKGGQQARRILLIVPAQYTFSMEQAAFERLEEAGFIDLHILSGQRLRHRILQETGSPPGVVVNQLGRHLLLRSVVDSFAPSLDAFAKIADHPDFLAMAGAFIASLKQNRLEPEDIGQALGQVEAGSLMGRKLADMEKIYRAYRDALSDKWLDSEDLIPEVTRRVTRSRWVAESEIWYHNFYSFTPTELAFMGELMGHAPDLHLLLCGEEAGLRDEELFEPTRRLTAALREEAAQRGVAHQLCDIPDSYEVGDRPPALAHLEKELYAFPGQPLSSQAWQDDGSLRLLRASNPYEEAAVLAAEIRKLLVEDGLLPHQIAVLTNDTDLRGTILRRTFRLYGIPCFLDEKRPVLHNPLIRTLVALLKVGADGWQTEDVLDLLKPGLIRWDDEETSAEAWENYLRLYHIRGERFLKPFTYGSAVYGEEGLAGLEAMRQRLSDLLLPFYQALNQAPTVRDKSALLFTFLEKAVDPSQRLEALSLQLEGMGLTDEAQENRQMWNLFAGLLDQLVELLGDRPSDLAQYRDLVLSSVGDLRVGMLPQDPHSVLIGTVSRSRLPRVRALFIAGVNDGILPSEGSAEGILTDREYQLLEELGFTFSKGRQAARLDEQLVTYQAFSRPLDRLFVSYAAADLEGREILPSSLIAQLKALFPQLKEEGDLGDDSREARRFRALMPAAYEVTTALRKVLAGEEEAPSAAVRRAYNYFLRHEKDTARAIREGLFFDGSLPPTPQALTRQLYHYDEREGAYIFSPSRLEQFARCPFRHFVDYGLKPRSDEPFEISPREVGNVYHECLMRLTRQLAEEALEKGLTVSDAASPWMTLSREDCDARVDAILAAMEEEMLDGLLLLGREQRYRTRRMQAVIREFIWQVLLQVRKGKVLRILPEAGFGRGRDLPPLRRLAGGEQVLIEGKIDRVDELAGRAGQPHMRVIDYKSGSTKFDREEVLKGLQLQLMVYLESALAASEEALPAGTFYCPIAEPDLPASSGDLLADRLSQELLEEREKLYRMDGLFVSDPSAVESMDGSLSDGQASTVFPVTARDGAYRSTQGLEPEAFQAFREEFKATVDQLCRELTGGDIQAAPRRLGRSGSVCDYCSYRSICLFDTDFEGCRYR